MPSTQLTPQQEKVADAIVDFALSGSHRSNYLAVAGYAGTGKTTVMGVSAARIVQRHPNIAIGYCAPTGKAAGVLGGKLRDFGAMNGNSLVHTIHGHIYRLNKSASKGGKMVWDSKMAEEVPYDLLVVDEASMVTQQIFSDLMKYHVPVIFIGDSGQLPPVQDRLFQPLTDTEFVLTEVHRQALENPIVRWATEVRNGGRIPLTTSSHFARMSKRDPRARKIVEAFVQKLPAGDSMILCGMNRTRLALNGIARKQLGFSGQIPNVGERLICLKNHRAFNLYNGQIHKVSAIGNCVANDSCYLVDLEDNPVQMVAFAGALNSENGKVLAQRISMQHDDMSACLKESFQDDPMLFDYGYCCSVHKAQGSEWDNVLLYDERNSHMSDDDYRRWLYTGMTRAREKLCILCA